MGWLIVGRVCSLFATALLTAGIVREDNLMAMIGGMVLSLGVMAWTIGEDN